MNTGIKFSNVSINCALTVPLVALIPKLINNTIGPSNVETTTKATKKSKRETIIVCPDTLSCSISFVFIVSRSLFFQDDKSCKEHHQQYCKQYRNIVKNYSRQIPLYECATYTCIACVQ